MLVRPVQPSKADSPIDVTLSGISIPVSPVQPSKAESPIDVTLFGIVKIHRSAVPIRPRRGEPDARRIHL